MLAKSGVMAVLSVVWALVAMGAEPPTESTVIPVSADKRLYAQRGNTCTETNFYQLLVKHIPPLRHARGQRWPMIMWEGGTFDPQPKETYQALLARGLTQHIQLDAKMLSTAKALQAAGSPVIMVQGAGGSWPAELAGAPELWAHQFTNAFKTTGHLRPCLAIFTGWAINADKVRATLRQFKEAGVTVQAVWMDWEGDPLFQGDAYIQAAQCRRCREILPTWVLASEDNFRRYSWRLYNDLIAAYLAAPVREIFPACSVANWNIVVTIGQPVLHWTCDKPISPGLPGMLTAMNPVAYGQTYYFTDYWKKEYPLDMEHVDQFYTHLLLHEVTGNAVNAAAYAPEKEMIPWVCRWCPDNADPRIPVMSRERYREVLRHLWLRGVDGMQIFNPSRKGYEDMAVYEVADAVAVYDEMLEFKEYLDEGEPFGLDLPKAQDNGVLWSGRRRAQSAVVRVFKQGGGEAEIVVEPWPGKKSRLQATDQGRTYLLKLDNNLVRVEKLATRKE